MLFTHLDETADGPLHCVSGEGRRDGLPDAFDGVTPAFQVGAFIDLETRCFALWCLCAPFAILVLPVLEMLGRVKGLGEAGKWYADTMVMIKDVLSGWRHGWSRRYGWMENGSRSSLPRLYGPLQMEHVWW